MTGIEPTNGVPSNEAPHTGVLLAGARPEQYGPYAAAPRTNTLAVVSLVSAFCIGLVAIITGHIALAQIRARGEAGRGLALAGLILGYAGVAATTLAVVFAVLFAATVATFVASYSAATGGFGSSAAPGDSGALPEGQVGAAHFDQGYLELGTGPVVIDQFFDPLCPYCRIFDETNAAQLALAVDNDVITLRLVPLTFLDYASDGTDYSTRAAAALTCEAAINPDSTLDYLAALYANQPDEYTSGLTDADLIALSTGPASIANCVASGEYRAWSQFNTEAAAGGDYANLPAITSTPSVFVDGTQYLGAIDVADEFSEFVSAAFD